MEIESFLCWHEPSGHYITMKILNLCFGSYVMGIRRFENTCLYGIILLALQSYRWISVLQNLSVCLKESQENAVKSIKNLPNRWNLKKRSNFPLIFKFFGQTFQGIVMKFDVSKLPLTIEKLHSIEYSLSIGLRNHV